MTRWEFRNGLCILRNIDRHELVEAGVIDETDKDWWPRFRVAPYETFLRLDDSPIGKMWALMKRRGA